MLTLLRKLHAWIGLGLSLVLFALALSGGLLVFKDDWTRATVPAARASAAVTAESAGRAMQAAQAAFPGKVRALTLAGRDLGVHTASLEAGGGAFLAASDAGIVARWDKNGRASEWLFDLHHRLFWGETGVLIAEWVGFAGLLLALTGLVLWWPQRRAFRTRIVPASNTRPGWLSAHRNLGVIAAPMLLMSLATGSAMALPKVSKPLLAAMFGGAGDPTTKFKASAAPVDWPALTTAAQRRFPDARLRILVPPRRPGQPVEVRLRRPGEWHANGRTRVWLDGDGRVLGADDALATGGAARVFNAFWPLHAGKVGGLPYRLLVAAGGLSLALLAPYGAESYRRKLFS